MSQPPSQPALPVFSVPDVGRAGGVMAPLLVLLLLAGCSSGGSSSGGDNPGSGDPVLTLSAEPTLDTIDVSWNAEDFPDADHFNLCWGESDLELAGFDNCMTSAEPRLEQGLDGDRHLLTELERHTPYYLMLEAAYADGDPEYSRQIAVVTSSRFNDTGITRCADGGSINKDCPVDDFEGQDAEHGRDALAANGGLEKVGEGAAGFDYTRICGNGEPEGRGSCPDGLKADEIGTGDRQWACTRDNVTGRMWEVRADYARLGSTSVEAYARLVNRQRLCGYDDWRLPAVDELYSLAHLGVSDPAIDEGYFPHTPPESFWSATRAAHDESESSAWYVDFSTGAEQISHEGKERHVRLVRDAW